MPKQHDLVSLDCNYMMAYFTVLYTIAIAWFYVYVETYVYTDIGIDIDVDIDIDITDRRLLPIACPVRPSPPLGPRSPQDPPLPPLSPPAASRTSRQAHLACRHFETKALYQAMLRERAILRYFLSCIAPCLRSEVLKPRMSNSCS